MEVLITNIDPITLEIQNYSSQDVNLISKEILSSQFDPQKNYIEYTISSINKSFQVTDQNFINYRVINDYSPSNSTVLYSIDIDPKDNLMERGFNNGEYNVLYTFLNNELSSSSETRPFYIKDISSDRTEIKIASNIIDNNILEQLVDNFQNNIISASYFQDFYLNFGGNILIIANNILLDNTKSQYEILINLYEPLPGNIRLKDTLWVVTQVANPLAFNIKFQPEVIIPVIENPIIKGPNFNLSLKDRINNSTNYINYEELLSTSLVSSYDQIISYLNEKNINISIDYSNFDNFIHFSSIKSRIENFYYKIQLIEQYNSDITTLSSVVSSSISESLFILQDKISKIIKNFDGYEYFLYYESGSTTYPKGNSNPPYDLLYSLDPIVITWYNDIIESASIYDNNNQDYLINTIPDYLIDDPINDPYKIFIDMIGQYYDNIWIYYKDVTNRYNGDNRLDYGISKDLVADALRSFGIKLYQNNFSTDDLYSAFTGFNFPVSISGSSSVINDGNVYTVSPYIVEGDFGYFLDDLIYNGVDVGELITNYVTASQEALYEPIDDINKEVYKRLYHNLPYLLKTKGTVTGLRSLINIYGIPDTILRISEFGGRDININTYDYFYNRYSYAFKTYNNALISIPWQPLYRNYLESEEEIVPDCIQFRFKTEGIPNTSSYTQSLLLRTDNTPLSSIGVNSQKFGIFLTYSGSNSILYSGSINPYEKYGKLKFYISGSPTDGGYVYSPDIELPFFDEGWWSIMLQRDQHISTSISSSNTTYTLYAANKIYDSSEGFTIGYIASSSIFVSGSSGSINAAWNVFSRNIGSESFGIRLGGNFNNIITPNVSIFGNKVFSGSFQEFRYNAYALSESQFKNYVMNPESIEGLNYTESLSSFDIVNFRAPLGNELERFSSSLLTYHSSSYQSYHPSITGSANSLITSSFLYSQFGTSSNYLVYYSASNDSRSYSESNVETYYFNQPTVGLKNRNNNKIQLSSLNLPSINLEFTEEGNTLSQYRKINQKGESNNSEIPDVNSLEVAFSPQNEIDDDIVSTLGYFNIGEYIGDPRFVSSSKTNYPDLNKLSNDYFKKYYDKYTIFDYIRLIKFFDNSLFKMIKDFVPARTNLRSGIIIKPHILERNRYPQPQLFWENETYTGSIDTAFFSGSTGGTFNEFNKLHNISGSILLNDSNFIIGFNEYKNLFENSGIYGTLISSSYFDITDNKKIISKYEANTSFEFLINLVGATTTYSFRLSSSLQGYIDSFSQTTIGVNTLYSHSINTNVSLDEIFELQLSASSNLSGINNTIFGATSIISDQRWYENVVGPLGNSKLIHIDQKEFYNGELPNSVILVSNGELNEGNEFKYPSTLEIEYSTFFYNSNITIIGDFLNINTSPNQGEIYLWYDTGSYI